MPSGKFVVLLYSLTSREPRSTFITMRRIAKRYRSLFGCLFYAFMTGNPEVHGLVDGSRWLSSVTSP